MTAETAISTTQKLGLLGGVTKNVVSASLQLEVSSQAKTQAVGAGSKAAIIASREQNIGNDLKSVIAEVGGAAAAGVGASASESGQQVDASVVVSVFSVVTESAMDAISQVATPEEKMTPVSQLQVQAPW